VHGQTDRQTDVEYDDVAAPMIWSWGSFSCETQQITYVVSMA